MVDYTGLRVLVGAKKFDKAVRTFKRNCQEEPAPKALASMGSEPDNSGLSIPDGRKALRRAAKRSFGLPELQRAE